MRPPSAARWCSASAAATSSWGTPTRSTREEIEGVGLLDVTTVREQGPRLIGNVAIELAGLPGMSEPGGACGL